MNKKNKVSIFDVIIIFTLVGVTPWLMGLLTYEYQYPMSYKASMFSDYFNLIKVNVIKFTSLIIVLGKSIDFLVTERSFSDRIDLKKIFTIKNVFAFLIVISTIIAYIFSDNKDVASFGAFERFEGIWVHFSYIVIFFFTLSFFKKEGSFKYFSISIMLSAFIVGLVGALQAIDINLITTEVIQIITTGKPEGLVTKSGGSYSTLYNLNTSASYSLIMMFTLGMIFTLNKNTVYRVVIVIDFVLIAITFINSYSEASYIALAVAFGVFILLLTYVFYKQEKRILVKTNIAVIFVALLTAVFLFTTNTAVKKLVASAIGPVSTFTDWEKVEDDFYFYNKDDDFIKVENNEGFYNIFENQELLHTITKDEFSEIKVNTENFDTIFLKYMYDGEGIDHVNFNNFFVIKNNENIIVQNNGFPITVRYVDFVGFEGYGALFTNRGYIWSRSLALFLENPIVGYGADNFFHIFPHDDYVGRRFNNFPNVLADKPHSIYLNMAINNGLFYLIGFLGIVSITIIEKFKLLKKATTDNSISYIAVLLYLSGLVAYLVNGMSTDNIVIIIMYFWIYLSISDKFFEKK